MQKSFTVGAIFLCVIPADAVRPASRGREHGIAERIKSQGEGSVFPGYGRERAYGGSGSRGNPEIFN